jgi:hypothetical protein
MGLVTEMAARQGGVFSAQQAESLGVDRRRLARAEAAGFLVRQHPGVFAVAGIPPTTRSLVRAATLHLPHGVASHESALLLHGVTSMRFAVVMSVPAGSGHRHPGIRIHRVRDLLDDHCTIVDGIPTTTLERAIVDVSCVFQPARLAHLIDVETMHTRRTSIAAIGRTLRQVNRRGRFGIGRLGPLLDARRPADTTPRSTLERQVDDLLARTDLPKALSEHPLPGDGGVRGWVDRAWPEAMLILEIDGRTWHAREQAMAKDRARDRAAAREGWLTIRVLDDEVTSCPDGVVDDVTAAFAMRVAQLRSSA